MLVWARQVRVVRVERHVGCVLYVYVRPSQRTLRRKVTYLRKSTRRQPSGFFLLNVLGFEGFEKYMGVDYVPQNLLCITSRWDLRLYQRIFVFHSQIFVPPQLIPYFFLSMGTS